MTPASRGRRRTPLERVRARWVFAISLLIFLVMGIVLVGAFSAQWWLLLLPVALLLGPAWALRREAGRQPGGDQQRTTRS